jgi:AcrR family transcriptional regulator
MSEVVSQRERVNQKRRTRVALVQAARALLDKGQTPTVADVADEALVSRATAYRYFPSQEHLLLEVVLERSIDEIDQAVDASAASDKATVRVEGLVSAIHEEITANEAGFRSLLRLSIAQRRSDRPTVASIRAERRLQWIEQALEPIAGDLDGTVRRRLVNALALCVGAEAFVVLRDLCGLSSEQAEDTLLWTARALLTSATNEDRGGKGRSAKR